MIAAGPLGWRLSGTSVGSGASASCVERYSAGLESGADAVTFAKAHG